ncbi:MAG: TIGR01777 family oxidoreductase [Anaerolineae bacterium]
MRVLVTGGTGLIGRALSASLARDGHEVLVLSRDPARAGPLPEGVRAVRWDARTAEGWGPLADGAWAIVNLAGASIAGEGLMPKRWTPARKDLILQSRLRAGQAVVEAVTQAQEKPQVVVQASGIGYYGPRGDEVIAEDAAAGTDWLSGVAVQWEATTAPVETLGVRRVVIRSAVVLSQEGGVLPLLLLPFRFFAGGPLGSGRQWVPWIHIADEVRAIRFLMERPEATGPFNLVAPHPLTNRELVRTIGRVLRRPAVVPVPAFALRLALGELATLVLDGQRAVPRRLSELGFAFQFPEVETALRNLLLGEPAD